MAMVTKKDKSIRLKKRNEISALEHRTIVKLEEYRKAYEKEQLIGRIKLLCECL